jgi:oligopeptide/dipeptide ABC transporter ATP-binding protein
MSTQHTGSRIEVQGLTLASMSGEVLVDDLDLTVGAGEVVALVGESGSGKSLTALAILGLLPRGIRHLKGRILLDGVDVTGLTGRNASIRGRRIASIFQDPQASLDPRWTVGRYLRSQFRRYGASGREAAAQAAMAMLGRVGLGDPTRLMRAYPHELSGGMAQRVMIAGSLAALPSFLIADEPTTALDVTTQAQILDLLEEIRQETGLGILMITHDLGVVAEMADRIAVLYGGDIMETGAATDVLGAPWHPYTGALLASMPDMEAAEPPLPIPGSPGDRLMTGTGCPFQPRCSQAIPACAGSVPPLVRQETRSAACHVLDAASLPRPAKPTAVKPEQNHASLAAR